jgi:quinolinate synthase
MLHQLRMANPRVRFEAVNPRAACPYMAMTTEQALLRCVTEGVEEVTVDPAIAERARQAVVRMVEIGTPSPVGE